MGVRTDLATVRSWANSIVDESRRIQIKGIGKMIKQRLRILQELISKFELQMKTVFVPSERDKVDSLI